MKISRKHRKWFWAAKIIHKFRGKREMSILHRENVSMNLLEDDIVEVKSEQGTCFVYIPKYNEQSCFICG